VSLVYAIARYPSEVLRLARSVPIVVAGLRPLAVHWNEGLVHRDFHFENVLVSKEHIVMIDTSAFTFLGFLPHKKGRQMALKRIAESEVPAVLYESPHRILKLVEELNAHGITRVVIARELTKVHEEIVSGTPAELIAYFTDHPDHVRGEFVVILEP
jgi:hypothetical protein